MAKRKSVTNLSRKARDAICKSIQLSANLQHSRSEQRRLFDTTGWEGKNKSNGEAPVSIARVASSAEELRFSARALKEEVKKWRKEVGLKRAECRRLFKSCRSRAEFINCEHYAWEQELHSSLYKRAEAVVVNFDYRVHAGPVNLFAKKFEREFRVLLDVRTRTVRFKRRI